MATLYALMKLLLLTLVAGVHATASLPATMQAFVAKSSSSFGFDGSFRTPQLGDLHATFGDAEVQSACEVIVAVSYSSVNPCDRGTDASRNPKVLGSDIAGVVAAVGDGCARLAVGDKVFGDIGANAHLKNLLKTKTKELGAYAQYAVALESQLAKLPAGFDLAEAGSLPKVALTSYKALGQYADGANSTSSLWRDGPTVLVLGGSGGTGTCGLQLARQFGAAHVITTTSADNADYCTKLGADRVIDYKTQNWWDTLESDSVDVVYDTVGERGTGDRALDKIRAGGHYVTITGAMPTKSKAGVTANMFINSDTNLDNHAMLDEIASLMGANKLRMPSLQQTFGLADVQKAFDLSAGGQVVGKVSIKC